LEPFRNADLLISPVRINAGEGKMAKSYFPFPGLTRSNFNTCKTG
jgi:hypothetical protein